MLLISVTSNYLKKYIFVANHRMLRVAAQDSSFKKIVIEFVKKYEIILDYYRMSVTFTQINVILTETGAACFKKFVTFFSIISTGFNSQKTKKVLDFTKFSIVFKLQPLQHRIYCSLQ